MMTTCDDQHCNKPGVARSAARSTHGPAFQDEREAKCVTWCVVCVRTCVSVDSR